MLIHDHRYRVQTIIDLAMRVDLLLHAVQFLILHSQLLLCSNQFQCGLLGLTLQQHVLLEQLLYELGLLLVLVHEGRLEVLLLLVVVLCLGNLLELINLPVLLQNDRCTPIQLNPQFHDLSAFFAQLSFKFQNFLL